MTDILLRNNVNIVGNGPQTILFAHGFGGDQNAWRHLSNALSEQYRVVLFDFVGCGNSDFSAYSATKYKTLRGYAEDVLDICQALQLKDAIFVGHSVACMVGMLAAIESPAYFKRLIFLGPSACYLNDGNYAGGINPSELDALFEVMDNNYQGWARAMAPAIMGNADRPELGEGFANDWIEYDPAIAANFARATFLSDNRPYLSMLQVPSLSIICEEDILATASATQYIADHTPGNTMVKLNANGHCPHLSAPQEVIKTIKNYLLN
ncbi:alpha/beta hydrolase [Mucilaginibacter sp. Bleaf8]|uniref:alpha/beta fold hydrolase n=1 Tax=Mucilaginibacter sp. Bleaf8 TaxID=2834430 RepID=UPI001BCD85BA|nr:alpha/beta hydrolase [Mucilaginibacter sp. Bleaf8]MBS7563515.1 alpha/beta hydrolase [Mucilaginibacter sp. Bleaf8]